MLAIKIINQSNNELPAYATVGSSGMDLRANIETPISLGSLERFAVPTGIYLEIPNGYEAQIRPRSGLAFKNGITCLNTPGTIDADYRGELKVILVNLSKDIFDIQPGERIAQMVFCKIEQVELTPAASLDETERGAGGFGSTGLK